MLDYLQSCYKRVRSRSQTFCVARSEFVFVIYHAQKACNIKLGPRNAKLSLLLHLRVFTRAHSNVTFCNAERPDLDVAQSCNTNATLLSIADLHTRLRRHSATPVLRGVFHLRNATVNFEFSAVNTMTALALRRRRR